MTGRKAALPREAGGVALQNRLPAKHPHRLALETAIRGALAGLEGSWDVLLEAPDGHSLVVAVIAPDGSSWTMSYCSPAHQDPDSIASTVRAACSRRRWLNPGSAAGAGPRRRAESNETPAAVPGGKRS